MDQLTPSAKLRLENQVAVVTGGARGIGAGIVQRFVEEGAELSLAIFWTKGKSLEKELGNQRTAVNPLRACLRCVYLLSGRSNLCLNRRFFGGNLTALSLECYGRRAAGTSMARLTCCGPLTSPKLRFRSADRVSVQPLSVRTGTENAGAKKTV
jgi:hypothetical protein